MKSRELVPDIGLGIAFLLIGFSFVFAGVALTSLADLEADVVNVYCSSGLHSDPCYTNHAWAAAESGSLTCGGRYARLLGYCFEPGEYESREATWEWAFRYSILSIIGSAALAAVIQKPNLEETPP